MKAIHQSEYGTADVLRFGDVAQPVPGDQDVLIRVEAASLHIGDWHVMTGFPYMLRAIGFGVRAPKVPVRGVDVAGVVVAVGKQVSSFRKGDEVFGTCSGSFAEYACASEENFALKPANLTLQEAATLPTSSFAALQALRDCGEVRAGQSVLILGATGAVGSFAVQIAKSLGARVTAACSTSNVERARSLGADEVIDYTKDDLTSSHRRYDVVLETGGNRPLPALRRLVRPGGIVVMIGGEGGRSILGGTSKWLHALALAPFVSDRMRPLATKPNKKDLLRIKDLAESGQLKTTIDRTFPLTAAPDAFRYLRLGSGRGKIVIQVA